jgi:hypothetical protein
MSPWDQSDSTDHHGPEQGLFHDLMNDKLAGSHFPTGDSQFSFQTLAPSLNPMSTAFVTEEIALETVHDSTFEEPLGDILREVEVGALEETEIEGTSVGQLPTQTASTKSYFALPTGELTNTSTLDLSGQIADTTDLLALLAEEPTKPGPSDWTGQNVNPADLALPARDPTNSSAHEANGQNVALGNVIDLRSGGHVGGSSHQMDFGFNICQPLEGMAGQNYFSTAFVYGPTNMAYLKQATARPNDIGYLGPSGQVNHPMNNGSVSSGTVLQRDGPQSIYVRSLVDMSAPAHGTGYQPKLTADVDPSLVSPYTRGHESLLSPSKPGQGSSLSPARPSGSRKRIRHKRGERDNPKEFYSPLTPTPVGWPAEKPIFSYTPQGEWDLTLSFSREELHYYMFAMREKLTMWVQTTPAQYKYRYPDDHSSKCRWRDCPASRRTILKGWYRVCFDENPQQTGITINPFHNAGYVHLWCMEEMFDLAELVDLGLQPDGRVFEREVKNPMALTRDHAELWEAYLFWMERERQDLAHFYASHNRSQPRPRLEGQRLGCHLTLQHLALESKARGKARAVRNGNSLEKHCGNLRLFIQEERRKKKLQDRANWLAKREAAAGEYGAPLSVSSASSSSPISRSRRAARPQVANKPIAEVSGLDGEFAP